LTKIELEFVGITRHLDAVAVGIEKADRTVARDLEQFGPTDDRYRAPS
jgi:hypothetical protein